VLADCHIRQGYQDDPFGLEVILMSKEHEIIEEMIGPSPCLTSQYPVLAGRREMARGRQSASPSQPS
jgi:hypothetical protein